MNRRKLLSTAPAAMLLAGAAAGGTAAPPLASPILDAARRIAVLNQQHDAADAVRAGGAELDRIWCLVQSQEAFILAATPTTVTEAMVVLMVAVGNIDTAGNSEAADAMDDAATSAAARATRCLARVTGVDVAEFGGDVYLPPSCAGRTA